MTKYTHLMEQKRKSKKRNTKIPDETRWKCCLIWQKDIYSKEKIRRTPKHIYYLRKYAWLRYILLQWQRINWYFLLNFIIYTHRNTSANTYTHAFLCQYFIRFVQFLLHLFYSAPQFIFIYFACFFCLSLFAFVFSSFVLSFLALVSFHFH